MQATNHPKGRFPRGQFSGGYCQGAIIFGLIFPEQSSMGAIFSGGQSSRDNCLGGSFPDTLFFLLRKFLNTSS